MSGGSRGEVAGTETVSGSAGGVPLGVVSSGFAVAAFVASAGFEGFVEGGAGGFVVVGVDADAAVGVDASAVAGVVDGAGEVDGGLATDATVTGAPAVSTLALRRVTRMPTPIATIMPTAMIGRANWRARSPDVGSGLGLTL